MEIGQNIIIDGVIWNLHTIDGHAGRASRDGLDIVFDVREAHLMAPDLWCLPGRVEPPRSNPDATTSVIPAVAESL